MAKVDRLGLYEIDVHYYMTFYLAVTSGITAEDARIMASATQYIDDNPLTTPVNRSFPGILLEPIRNHERLRRYHFTQWDMVDGERVWNTSTNLDDNDSQQLRDLYSYAGGPEPGSDGESCIFMTNATRGRRLQFMGEYLHAFEDTFAHRDNNNVPIDTNLGFGHLVYMHDPDQTYDHEECHNERRGNGGSERVCTQWNNAARTRRMEERTREEIQRFMSDTNYAMTQQEGRTASMSEISATLDRFNQTQEDGDHASAKLEVLQQSLERLGYRNADGSAIRLVLLQDESSDAPGPDYRGYVQGVAATNRTTHLKGVNADDYGAAILPDH